MPAKTPVKRKTRTKSPVTKKPQTAKKPAKKITQADIEANFDRIQKSQNEAWKAIREVRQAHKETEKAIRETQKAHKETEKTIRETQQAQKEAHKKTEKAKDEAWAAIRETQKNIGGLGNTFGSLVEHILTPDLPQKFKKLGYAFNRISGYKWAEGVYAEIDGMLENGTQAVVVEVKTTLRQIDINNHLVRMEKVRRYADEHGDKRQFMGAMAATITDEASRNYALSNGLFVIEPSGEDVKVTKPENEPRVW